MNPTATLIALSAAILSLALGVSGDYILSGFIGYTLVVLGTIANAASVLMCPHLLIYGRTDVGSVTFFAVPALLLAGVFGLLFFGWQGAMVYGLLALVGYLISSAIAINA